MSRARRAESEPRSQCGADGGPGCPWSGSIKGARRPSDAEDRRGLREKLLGSCFEAQDAGKKRKSWMEMKIVTVYGIRYM